VRAMAVWAMRQLTHEDFGEPLKRRHLEREGDAQVRAEWQAAPAS
jgi:epoxyqueuosine reductase